MSRNKGPGDKRIRNKQINTPKPELYQHMNREKRLGLAFVL